MYSINEIYEKLEEKANQVTKYSRIIIVGANFAGKMACDSIAKMSKQTLFVCDNDTNKHTDKFYKDMNGNWISCRPVQSILSESPEDVLCLITVCKYYQEIANQLSQYDCGITYMPYTLYVRCMQVDKLKEVYNLLRREQSKDTLRGLLQADIDEDTSWYGEVYRDYQYFGIPEFKVLDASEVFYEAGAYMGETIEEYLRQRSGCFRKIVAFEPGVFQCKAMGYRLKRLKLEWGLEEDSIVVHNVAVGEKEGSICVSSGEKDRSNTHLISSE